MLDIILEKQLPVVSINFCEVKASIEQAMEKYKGLVVTEEELAGCKATQKELAGYRIKLDTYRKEVKKEMEVPIKEFENQCKELIGLVTDAEEPIKAGIEVFNEKIRDAKRIEAQEYILTAITEQQLNEKYASQLTILDKYTMLSAKAKDTKTDIDQRAFILLQEQDREIEALRLEEERKAEILRIETERLAELKALEEKRQIELAAAEVIRKAENLEIAKSTIEQANTQIKEQIQIEDYIALIESGVSSMSIIQEINKKKHRIIEAEKPVIETTMTIPVVVEIPKEEVKEEIELPFAELPKTYFVEMRVEGSLEEITSLSKFLKDNGYNYTKKDSGLLE